ncbi:MAG: hypothetical protein GY845_11120 [Planctomycetes bacterium]|nr:hypothetical protein [Planctomycetota bacterium]
MLKSKGKHLFISVLFITLAFASVNCCSEGASTGDVTASSPISSATPATPPDDASTPEQQTAPPTQGGGTVPTATPTIAPNETPTPTTPLQGDWQVIDPTSINGTPDFSDVFFVNENTGYISCSSNANIFRTDDGATNFTTQSTQYTTEAIYMTDINSGFAGGASGRVYYTSEGGLNWPAIDSISVTLIDLDFATTSQGYACGDSGAVYSITSTGVANLNSGQPTFFSGISTPSVDNVWICGGNDVMYYDGSTFSFQSGPGGTYNSIFFINDQEGWIVGNNGVIGHTENGGNSWTSQTNPDSNSLYGIFCLNQNEGWAVGAQGTILQTTNGGDTWTVQGAGLTTAFLRGVHFVSTDNGNVGYVVGNGKTLIKFSSQ